MMRRAPTPHGKCGNARVCSRRGDGLRLAYALACLTVIASILLLLPPAYAQDPSVTMQGPKSKPFPNKPGGIIGPKPKIDRAQPLYMQADQLIYDTRNNRVIAQGNVEIYYNNYILTADQVVYDQGVNKLIAEGNAQLKDPNGGITRADRFEALDDFRDAFIQSLSVVAAGRHAHRRRAARAAREGNTTEYERGKFTPLQERPWHAAAVVHRRRAHHPRSARGHHHLSGRAVRAVRRADPLHALLPASRPVGEAPARAS